MKFHPLPSIFILLFIFNSGIKAQNQFNLIIPSVEDEVQYIWNNIQDIAFFEQHNYQLSLPQGKLIEDLKAKAKAGNLTETDKGQLHQFMQEKVYRKSDYDAAAKIILTNKQLIDKMIKRIKSTPKDWSFLAYDQYQVKLTLYGPGGSYNPEEGSVLLFATPDGKFKQYDNPANTIIHEIVHIGIENSIIQQFQVPHPAKERIVDLIVQLNFQKWLPEYRLQGFGDSRVNTYVVGKKDIKNLDQLIAQFMRENRFESSGN